jgi:hypothetical protein
MRVTAGQLKLRTHMQLSINEKALSVPKTSTGYSVKKRYLCVESHCERRQPVVHAVTINTLHYKPYVIGRLNYIFTKAFKA